MNFNVKICCISSPEEAQSALNAGADYLGFVSEMPSGPGVISLKKIAEIVSSLPSNATSILLTSMTTADEILTQHKLVKTSGVQLVAPMPLIEMSRLRELLPNIFLIRVVHVSGPRSIDEALAVSELADMLILDSGQPFLTTPTLGGTGQVHDWNISRQICSKSPLPVLLAGGLNIENVTTAIRQVKPSGVDVCSGVRSGGFLDEKLLEKFMQAVKRAAIVQDRPSTKG